MIETLKTTVNGFRLWLCAALSHLASKAAPREIKPVLRIFSELLSTLPEQMTGGRTGGVIVSHWSVDEDGQRLGIAQKEAALKAAAAVRKNWSV